MPGATESNARGPSRPTVRPTGRPTRECVSGRLSVKVLENQQTYTLNGETTRRKRTRELEIT